MRRETRQLLYDLEEVTWFHAVGKPALEDEVVQVRSWREAIETCGSEEWQETRTEHANQIRLQLTNDEMRRWNPMIDSIKPDVAELVEQKAVCLSGVVPNISELINTARWDVLHACMETEFAERLHTRFYRDVADLYLRGHFPCGWSTEGLHPKHIIY